MQKHFQGEGTLLKQGVLKGFRRTHSGSIQDHEQVDVVGSVLSKVMLTDGEHVVFGSRQQQTGFSCCYKLDSVAGGEREGRFERERSRREGGE